MRKTRVGEGGRWVQGPLHWLLCGFTDLQSTLTAYPCQHEELEPWPLQAVTVKDILESGEKARVVDVGGNPLLVCNYATATE